MASVMDWTPRKGTRAAAHFPEDAEDVCEEAFFRQMYIMKWNEVHPKVSSSIPSHDTIQ
jgi:hypothetical protein